MQQERIKNFESLKSIAYISIILNHAGFKYLKFGGFGVSIFLILSGFMLMNKYYDSSDLDNSSLKNNFIFAINKIKPLYILHIVCVAIYLPTLFFGNVRDSIGLIIYKVFTNILLIQEWIPLGNSSLNECSWYLSAVIFCYFMFPYVLNTIKKNKIKKPLLYILLIFLIQIFIAFIALRLPTTDGFYIRYWLVYRFPLVRFFDFSIGCLLYLVYRNNAKCSVARSLEFSGIFLSIVAFVLIVLNISDSFEFNYFLKNYNTILYTAIFTPGSCLLIYSLAFDEKITLSFLYNNFFMFISKYGKHIFLIHYLVFDLIRIFLTLLGIIGVKHNLANYLPFINVSLGILITFFLSKKWDIYYNRITSKL